MDKLANWPSVLNQFKDMLTKSSKPVEFTPDERSTPFRLLRHIARNNMAKNYTAIESNFLFAAMHLACMKEFQFQRDTCPDLPENLDITVRT